VNNDDRSQIAALNERTNAIGGDIDEVKSGPGELTRAIKGNNGTPGMAGQLGILKERIGHTGEVLVAVKGMDDRLRCVEDDVWELKLVQEAYPSILWLL